MKTVLGFTFHYAVKIDGVWKVTDEDEVLDDRMVFQVGEHRGIAAPDEWIEVDSPEWQDVVNFTDFDDPTQTRFKREDITNIIAEVVARGGIVRHTPE